MASSSRAPNDLAATSRVLHNASMSPEPACHEERHSSNHVSASKFGRTTNNSNEATLASGPRANTTKQLTLNEAV